jgi:hypothetical protein
LDTLYNISNFESLSNYSSTSPYVASYEYNLKNVLLEMVTKALSNFINAMSDIYEARLFQTQLIVYICVAMVGFLILLQIPFICSIDSIIRKQAELFLRMPTAECHKQQKLVELFLEEMKVRGVLTPPQDIDKFGGSTASGLSFSLSDNLSQRRRGERILAHSEDCTDTPSCLFV